MKKLQRELGSLGQFFTEPLWLYHGVPFFRQLSQSPFYQRLLVIHSRTRYNRYPASALWIITLIVAVLIIIISSQNPSPVTISLMLGIGLLAIPEFLLGFTALFIMLPTRIQNLVSGENYDILRTTPTSFTHIMESEIFFSLIEQSRAVTHVQIAGFFALVFTIPACIANEMQNGGGILNFYAGLFGGLIISGSIMVFVTILILTTGYISASLALRFPVVLSSLITFLLSILIFVLSVAVYLTLAGLVFNVANLPGGKSPVPGFTYASIAFSVLAWLGFRIIQSICFYSFKKAHV